MEREGVLRLIDRQMEKKTVRERLEGARERED